MTLGQMLVSIAAALVVYGIGFYRGMQQGAEIRKP